MTAKPKKQQDRNGQLSRTLRLIRLLELNPQGIRVVEMLKKLNEDGIDCSRYTIYRDLQGIQSAHIPIINEGKGQDAIWKLDNIVKLSKGVHFTYNELFALYLTRESLRFLEHSPIFDIMDGFFKKLEDILGHKAHEGLAELSRTVAVRPEPSWMGGVSRETIDTVHAACSEGHVLEIEYQSIAGENAGKITSRRVGPLALYFADSGAYLIGMDLKVNKVKTFAIPRIKHAVMLDEVFDNHGFDVDAQLGASIGVFNDGDEAEVELFIEEPIASYIAERRYHPSQRVIRKENGIAVTMTVQVNNELARWVLGLGPAALVLKPEALKKEVLALAEQILSKSHRRSA